jgi:hypothetical protein
MFAILWSAISHLGFTSWVSFFSLALLFAWRLWRFTIYPAYHPEEPKELPYWIPGLGHAISYLRDSYSTLTYGREYFNDDRKPFSINLAGELMYIITSPDDVKAAYRNTPSLTMDVFLQDLMSGFDVNRKAVEKVYWKPNQDGTGFQLLSPNPSHKSLASLTVDFYREQLYPGPRLTQLGEITCSYIEQAVRWDTMTSHRYTLSHAVWSKDISLLHWCEDVLLRAAARSFFGDALFDINPNMIEDFLNFDSVSWKLMYRYPKILSRDMVCISLMTIRDPANKISCIYLLEYVHASVLHRLTFCFQHKHKDGLIDAVESYFTLSKDERPDGNWFIQMQEAEMRSLGISTRDMSKFIALIYWVINTNAYKLLFWMISFLLQDQNLIREVSKELQATFRADGSLDVAALQSQTPYLTALWHETLRVCNSSASARFVTADTVIGEYTLRAGRRLLIPYRQLHLNKAIFGENAADFDITRFLNDSKLAQNPSYRPFGGGATYCPGRFLAKQEIFMALAFLLHRNDIRLAPLATSSDYPVSFDELCGQGKNRSLIIVTHNSYAHKGFEYLCRSYQALFFLFPTPIHSTLLRLTGHCSDQRHR